MTATESTPKSEPWWSRLIPDVRGVVMVGYFCLAARLLYMIEGNPALLKDAAFIGISTMVMGSGGLGIVTSFLFGGTQTGSEVMKAQSKAVINSPPPVVPDGTHDPADVHFMDKPV